MLDSRQQFDGHDGNPDGDATSSADKALVTPAPVQYVCRLELVQPVTARAVKGQTP